MTSYKVIGKPTERADGPAKVTGLASYAADVRVDGMLFAKVLRSPFPHARIVRIGTSRAREVPGVHAVLTGADTAGHLQGTRVRDVPVLADGTVRFAGEKVAVVAADDEETAQRALDLIDVAYEELPPLLDVQEAMGPDAPLLHPGMLEYEGFVRPAETPSNVFFRNSYGIGDVEEGFAKADRVFESTYLTTRTHQGFLEPRASVVWADHDGRVEVWTSHKAPHNLKRALALSVGLEPHLVRVNPTYVGGDFGAKAAPWDEPLCYLLSLRTGRPVKMVMDYGEEFVAGNPRHASIIRMKTGVKSDGTLTAHLQEFIFDSGAYAGLMPLGFLAGVDRIAANFKIPHARFDVTHVYTNNVPGGYMRGPGEAQGAFAIESHMDEIAREMGMDPVEFRRKNILREGDVTPMDEQYVDVRAEETLDAVVEASGFHGPKPTNVGRGLAMCSRPAGGGVTHAAVTLAADGSVVIETPLFEQGSGVHTLLRQVVAEVLDVEPRLVSVVSQDTDAVESDSGMAGSRTTRMAVPAAYDAAHEAKAGLIGLAAERLDWPADRISCEDGALRRTDTGERAPWARVLGDSTVTGRATSNQQGRPDCTSFGALVAEVAVDPETGQVTLLKLTSAFDTGQVLNPIGHQGQINGGIIMGLGYAVMEELRVEDGLVTTLSFADVKVPNIQDVPPLDTVLIESDAGTGPYNAKAIGESPVLGVAPAIANAVRDAVGVRLRSLPITAEKVREAIAEQGSS